MAWSRRAGSPGASAGRRRRRRTCPRPGRRPGRWPGRRPPRGRPPAGRRPWRRGGARAGPCRRARSERPWPAGRRRSAPGRWARPAGRSAGCPTEFHRRAPAQDSTPATTNTPASILIRSASPCPFARVAPRRLSPLSSCRVADSLTTTRAAGVPGRRGRDAVAADAGQQLGDRAAAGELGLRVDVVPRGQDEGPLVGAGVGSVSTGSSETTSSYATMSTSMVRGPQRSSRTRSKASSIAWARSRREDGGRVVFTTHHRVEVRRLGAGRDAPRLGLVDRRDRLDPDAGGVLQGVDRALEGLQAVAEVLAEGDHGALGVGEGHVGGVHLLDHGGGHRLDGRVALTLGVNAVILGSG